MPTEFDPFLEWLGIDPDEHPVDHYRLLGIPRFEANMGRIKRAVEERMTHVRSFQTGPRGSYTQEILNALATAKLCLLDEEAKAQYDDSLRQTPTDLLPPTAGGSAPQAPTVLPPGSARATAQPPRPSADPMSPMAQAPRRRESAPAPVVDSPEPAEAPARKPPLRAIVYVVGVIFVATLVFVVGALIWNPKKDDPVEPAAADPAEQQEEPETIDEVEQPAQRAWEGVVVMQEGNGEVQLAATLADSLGELELVRHEEAHVLGNWTSLDDAAGWRFKIIRPGYFHVQITYSIDSDAAGGKFHLTLDDRPPKLCDIRSTGGQATVTDEYSVLIDERGEHTLSLAAVEKPGKELMRLHGIRLVPFQP